MHVSGARSWCERGETRFSCSSAPAPCCREADLPPNVSTTHAGEEYGTGATQCVCMLVVCGVGLLALFPVRVSVGGGVGCREICR